MGGFLVAGGRRFRALDLFGTQALARSPFLIAATVTNLPGFAGYNAKLIALAKQNKLTLPTAPAAEMLAFTIVTFLMITVGFVALAWKSFRISCDARGWLAVTAFAIILAEVLSKAVFHQLLLPML
jgi:hypothetical protein